MNLSPLNKSRSAAQCLGMTLLETLVAIMMLTVFTGVVAMVMQFTLRFFSLAESGVRNQQFNVSNGVLIDHQQLYIAMDALADLLSQPGISLARLKGQTAQERCPLDDPQVNCVRCTDDVTKKCYPDPQIAFDNQSDKPEKACMSQPVTQWGLSALMPEVKIPPGYRLCLWTTTEEETGVDHNEEDIAGIYLLQALPEQISDSGLPVRRLFCRPRAYC